MRSRWCVVLMILSVAGAGASYDPAEEIAALNALISERGYGWVAGETDWNRLPPEERPVFTPMIPPPGQSGLLPVDALTPRPSIRELPAVWDWRIEGGTTPVRNQGYHCASCWAFGAVAVFESAIMVATGRAEDLSEQQVIDCNTGGWGCSGGPRSAAYEIFMTYGAVAEACLPYIDDENPTCEQGSCEPIDYMDDWADVPPDITSLKEAVYEQPLAVGMTVYEDIFSYTGGCYENDEQQPANHAVLIVGWDDTMCDGAGAWIVKNSWGPNWGDEGYVYIKYGSASIGTMAQRVYYTPREPLVIRHTPTPDLPSQGERIEISCEIRAWDYLIDDDEVILHFDTGAGWEEMPMMRAPGEGERVTFTALLPPQPNWTLIEYWLSAADLGGNACVHPPDAPDSTHSFRILPIVFYENAEQAGEWTFGAPDDDATAGFWERGIPEGTFSPMGRQGNPDADHTPDPGVRCFCTGLAAGANFWDHDVDGGKTTLITPTLDLAWATAIDIIYYRWYTNDCGQYGHEDYWQVDASGDGGATWVNLESTCASEAAWVEQSFSLHEYIPLSDQVLIRFIASDYVNPSIVEAGIDDVYLYIPEVGAQGCTSSGAREARVILHAPRSPIEGNITFTFDVPHPTHGRLQVIRMDGRSVWMGMNGRFEVGAHVIEWNGRNDRGNPAPAGMYIVRLETGFGSAAQRLLKLR